MKQEPRKDTVEHLEELRARILRGILYIGVGTAIAWVFYDPLYRLLTAPVVRPLTQVGGKIGVLSASEWFFTQCKVSLVVGIIISIPGWFYEIWAFLAPGLTENERKAVRPIVPASVLLFLIGVMLGYLIMPRIWWWLVSFTREGGLTLQSLDKYIMFVAKLLLAFGIGFQLPMVVFALVKLGIVSSDTLAAKWREAMLLIAITSAMFTPGGDPFSMLAIALPLSFLYLVSIRMAKIIEPKKSTPITAEADDQTEITKE